MTVFIFSSVAFSIILINFLVGVLRHKSSTYSQYFANPNQYGWPIISMSVIGTVVGGGMFLAVGQIGYEAGVVGFVIGLASLMGFCIVGMFSGRLRVIMDESKSETLLELLEQSYSHRTVFQFCLINLAIYGFMLAGQLVAMLDFCRFVEPHVGYWAPRILVGFAGLTILIYPIIGGLRKDILTDIFQVIIILIAALIIVYRMINESIVSDLYSKVPETLLTGTAYGSLFTIGTIIFLTPSFLVRMDIWQRVRTAKEAHDSRIGMIIAGFISCCFYFLFTLIGMWGRALNYDNSDVITLDIIEKQFSEPWLFGLLLGAFFSAVLSSADTFVNNTSLFATRLVTGQLWRNKEEKNISKQLLLTARYSGIVVIIIAGCLAMVAADFVNLFVGAFSLLLIYLPTIAGVLVPNWGDDSAAFWSGMISTLLFLVLFFSWNPKLAFAPAVLLSIFIYVGITFLNKRGKLQLENHQINHDDK